MESLPVQPEPTLSDEELRDFRMWREQQNRPRRIIVGISGASMQQYGLRAAEVLSETPGIETHLVVTDGAKYVMALEMFYGLSRKKALGEVEKLMNSFRERNVIIHNNNDQGSAISSGSYLTDGMVVIPCSAKTLFRIAHGSDDDLLSRAAFCNLKEHGRTVVIVPRETPITRSYILNLLAAYDNGAVILPPMPAFYHDPKDIKGIIDHTVGKVLDQFHIQHDLYRKWGTPLEQNLD